MAVYHTLLDFASQKQAPERIFSRGSFGAAGAYTVWYTILREGGTAMEDRWTGDVDDMIFQDDWLPSDR